MTEQAVPKLNPESHLLLDQPLLRVPYELSRKNFKTAQRAVERDRDFILPALNPQQPATSPASKRLSNTISSSPPTTLDATTAPVATLDRLIDRAENLKRKLTALHADEHTLHAQTRARIAHLSALYDIPSAADPRYGAWSQVRLSRLLVDYLLRSGFGGAAAALARERGVEALVDVEAFAQCHRVEASLRAGRTGEALGWCADNKQALKRLNSNLEFELRLQQFIELVRTGRTEKLVEAIAHARKYLASAADEKDAVRAAGLLAFAADTTQEPFKTLYSLERWPTLAALFLKTHHELLSLPSTPHLQVALSAGLSALKTPSCHSQHISPSANANAASLPAATSSPPPTTAAAATTPASSVGTSVCPICSTELNELARSVPYAHHSKSIVEHDPVVLPNGRVYGRERLERWNEKMGMPVGGGQLRDPSDPAVVFEESEIRRVYIL